VSSLTLGASRGKGPAKDFAGASKGLQ
jgi:hypothetical protein